MEKKFGIKYTKNSKIIYSKANNEQYKIGDEVVGISDIGEEIGKIVECSDMTEDEVETLPLIIRKVSKEDIEKNNELQLKAKNITNDCKQTVKRMNLDMKITYIKYTLDGKLLILFVAEQRVDFREFVKELVSKYKTRIELRQIGPRDELKIHSNIGICGREACCRTFLNNFDAVTIKNAKDQGLQINMGKLSGNCGRLMCCLRYEENTYKEILQDMPKYNEVVKYNGENAKVAGLEILKKKVKLKIGQIGEERYETVDVNKIKRNKEENEKRGEE